ncbi:hypothetical protein N0V93_005983 [Gnomoniopsis smithogilvyi]|uniref:Concanavalin A-like lectin/glucanase n=1 Tax=Gnomoniopsis smithogilvyi TaxID=1191159 RepID=A0A9W8YMS2_9PEZI|nr:hypothetical protein N0V93_005983 [Gnomoniopsis smithogilvyi]
MALLRIFITSAVLFSLILASLIDQIVGASQPVAQKASYEGKAITLDSKPTIIRHSRNWSGGINPASPNTSGYFAAAGMKFTAPAALGPDIIQPDAEYYAASIWVGIDGWSHGSALLQTGVTIEVNKSVSGEVAYVPWYEWWPAVAMRLDVPIGAGDEVELEVVMFNATSGKVFVQNHSRGEWVSRKLMAPQPDAQLVGKNVEWIVEDFALSEGGNVPLGDFGTITLRDCNAHLSTGELVGPSQSEAFWMRQDNMTRTQATIVDNSVKVEYMHSL